MIIIDDALVLRQRDRVKKYVRTVFPNYTGSAVDDLIADVFLRALERAGDDCYGSYTENAFMGLMMMNVIYDHINKRRNGRDAMDHVSETLEALDNEEDLAGEERFSDDDSMFSNSRYVLDKEDELRGYLAEIPIRNAIIFELRLMRGLSWEEIAEVLKCSTDNCRVICKKAVQQVESLIGVKR